MTSKALLKKPKLLHDWTKIWAWNRGMLSHSFQQLVLWQNGRRFTDNTFKTSLNIFYTKFHFEFVLHIEQTTSHNLIQLSWCTWLNQWDNTFAVSSFIMHFLKMRVHWSCIKKSNWWCVTLWCFYWWYWWRSEILGCLHLHAQICLPMLWWCKGCKTQWYGYEHVLVPRWICGTHVLMKSPTGLRKQC